MNLFDYPFDKTSNDYKRGQGNFCFFPNCDCSTVVEHTPQHPKVGGSSQATCAGTGRDKGPMLKNC